MTNHTTDGLTIRLSPNAGVTPVFAGVHGNYVPEDGGILHRAGLAGHGELLLGGEIPALEEMNPEDARAVHQRTVAVEVDGETLVIGTNHEEVGIDGGVHRRAVKAAQQAGGSVVVPFDYEGEPMLRLFAGPRGPGLNAVYASLFEKFGYEPQGEPTAEALAAEETAAIHRIVEISAAAR